MIHVLKRNRAASTQVKETIEYIHKSIDLTYLLHEIFYFPTLVNLTLLTPIWTSDWQMFRHASFDLNIA